METSGKEKMEGMEMGHRAPRKGVTPEKIAVGVLSRPAATLGAPLTHPMLLSYGAEPNGAHPGLLWPTCISCLLSVDVALGGGYSYKFIDSSEPPYNVDMLIIAKDI